MQIWELLLKAGKLVGQGGSFLEPEGTSLSTWQCLNKEAHSFKQLNREGTSEEKQGNGLKNAGIFLSFGMNHHSTPHPRA